MKVLELKIPPVLVTVGFATLMWLVSRMTPGFPSPAPLSAALVFVSLVMAAVFGLGGVRSFKRARTTVNPLTPEASTSLVTAGVYRFSRNPMYLALLFGLVAWGLWLGNYYSLALTVIYVVYMNRFQILPEERAMERLYGQDFLDYAQRVRRWI